MIFTCTIRALFKTELQTHTFRERRDIVLV